MGWPESSESREQVQPVASRVAGYALSFENFVNMLAGLFIGSSCNKFYKDDVNYKRQNLHRYTATAIAFLGISVTQSLKVYLLWSICLNSAQMFLRIILTEMMVTRSLPNQRGTIMGAGNSVSTTARLITPLLVGLVDDIWGYSSVNIVAAIAATFGILVSLRLDTYHKKESLEYF